jgi:hypothetical protein
MEFVTTRREWAPQSVHSQQSCEHRSSGGLDQQLGVAGRSFAYCGTMGLTPGICKLWLLSCGLAGLGSGEAVG